MRSAAPKILVTGGGGFIGQHVIRAYLDAAWIVMAVGRGAARLKGGCERLYRVELALPDPAFPEALEAFDPELVVHCAGPNSVDHSLVDARSDFYATAAVTFECLDALRQRAPRARFINLSSAAVYGNPLRLPISETSAAAPVSPYGFHKLLAERICQEFHQIYGLRTLSLRVFSAYGEGLRRQVIWDICDKARGEKRVLLRGTGAECRDFIHAQDIVQAIRRAADEALFEGECYNVASGRSLTIKELAEIIVPRFGSDREVAFTGLNPHQTPINWRADITRLEGLGFKTETSLESGLARYVTWFESQRKKVSG